MLEAQTSAESMHCLNERMYARCSRDCSVALVQFHSKYDFVHIRSGVWQVVRARTRPYTNQQTSNSSSLVEAPSSSSSKGGGGTTFSSSGHHKRSTSSGAQHHLHHPQRCEISLIENMASSLMVSKKTLKPCGSCATIFQADFKVRG